ncbi:hypothetical protein JHK87_001414 [Glycine soja]|nr:hypothetical protein JHK87_001414 [Glycine soja]
MVDLSSNQLQGPFPFIPKYVNNLNFSNNRFNSIISLDTGNHLSFIGILSLSNNTFHGEIPESFCNASRLLLLDLSDNNFVRIVPKCFATLSTTLRVFNFGGNKLRVKLAKLVTNVSRSILEQAAFDYNAVDASRYHNSIINNNKGQLMKFLRIQRAFTYLDMSSNNFEGPIPNELMSSRD